MSVPTAAPTEASEFALLAAICQSQTGIGEHADLESRWFTNPDYQLTLEALREIDEAGEDFSAELVLAFLAHTNQHADKYVVRSLFADQVSGTSLDYHKKILRKNWTASRLMVVRADIERAAKNGTFDRITELTQEAAALEAGTAVQSIGRGFGGVAAAELWPMADEPVQWLVRDIFSADQPTIFGAKQKSLKTTLLTDLAVSLASGFPWLNRFEIPQAFRVLMITGEASQKAAIRKLKKAAEFRNLRPEDIGDSIRIETAHFPTLPSLEDCGAVQEAVNSNRIDVVILDPLYMGLAGLNTANLTEVGPAMRRFMQHCQPAKTIIAHHVKKSASYDDAPNLEDLSQAGIAEFAGNYWLMGRMSEYTGDGKHELAIRYGGRDEQFGLLKLDFNERAWTADFTSLQDHRAFQEQARENDKVADMKQRMLKALKRCPDGLSESKLAEASGTKAVRNVFQTAVEELETANTIVVVPDFKSGRRTCIGYRISDESE
ncbi:AAA family ATPase [Fuerstiella marisgermanici]|uniref:AAA domain-containing protein n=1 Tax=Fuerstiella marisgermanici TaxID=1891926 RepID=A0A1P8WS87_9PLAN|nr:AAA family ATPase [Fuerstiella marisgermanici]APZ96932.1 hypothetical protein Fuma_06608 [Fuerstiella marisgermanici]